MKPTVSRRLPQAAAALVVLGLLGAAPDPAPVEPPPVEPDEAVLLRDRFAADEETELEGYEGPGFGRAFIEMIVALGIVCVLAYLLLGKLLPRLLRVPVASASGRLLSIVDRLPTDPRRSLMVVKMGDQHFLVGSSEQGLTLLARLDPGEVRDALAQASLEPRPAPWEGVMSLLRRRPGEEP